MKKDKVFIIAELSANHNGSLENAIETIYAAKRAGADAIKLQTYTAETLTINCKNDDFIIKNGTIWDGKTLFDLYNEAHTPWEWHKKLFEIARKEDLICFSSPFDKTAVDFLEKLNTPIYKIASFEIRDIPLIHYTASKGKPMIISTGIADFDDIKLALDTCSKAGNNDITLLKCTSSYPASIDAANLIMMKKFSQDFQVKVGVSDHSLGITIPMAAAAMGASVIEKHLIIDKKIGGPDAIFSLDEKEFTKMVQSVREVEKSIGKIDYNFNKLQKKTINFSRSLYVVKDIKKDQKITDEYVRSIRPGYGLHPKYLNKIIGEKTNQDLLKGTPFSLDFINNEC